MRRRFCDGGSATAAVAGERIAPWNTAPSSEKRRRMRDGLATAVHLAPSAMRPCPWNDQDGSLGKTGHALGHAADHRPAKARAPMAADDHELRVNRFGHAADRRGGRAGGHVRPCAHAAPHPLLEIGAEAGKLGADVRTTRALIRDRLGKDVIERLHHVQHAHVQLALPCNRLDGADRRPARRREVRGHQDAAIGFHERAPAVLGAAERIQTARRVPSVLDQRYVARPPKAFASSRAMRCASF